MIQLFFTGLQIKKGNELFFPTSVGDVIDLPDSGKYVLQSYKLAAYSDSVNVEIKQGLNVDTLKQKVIMEVIQKPKDYYIMAQKA